MYHVQWKTGEVSDNTDLKVIATTEMDYKSKIDRPKGPMPHARVQLPVLLSLQTDASHTMH